MYYLIFNIYFFIFSFICSLICIKRKINTIYSFFLAFKKKKNHVLAPLNINHIFFPPYRDRPTCWLPPPPIQKKKKNVYNICINRIRFFFFFSTFQIMCSANVQMSQNQCKLQFIPCCLALSQFNAQFSIFIFHSPRIGTLFGRVNFISLLFLKEVLKYT